MYDADLGIFYGADPAGQGYAAYAYCGNNPVTRVDKNGQFFFLPLLAAFVSFGINAWNGNIKNDGSVFASFLSAGVTAGVSEALSYGGFANGVVSGAAGAGVTMASDAAYGNRIDVVGGVSSILLSGLSEGLDDYLTGNGFWGGEQTGSLSAERIQLACAGDMKELQLREVVVTGHRLQKISGYAYAARLLAKAMYFIDDEISYDVSTGEFWGQVRPQADINMGIMPAFIDGPAGSGSGAYVLEFESGKLYVGKGLEGRMMQSAKRIEKLTGDNLKNKTFYPTKNSVQGFIKEHQLMELLNYQKNSPLFYNKIFSPGKLLSRFF